MNEWVLSDTLRTAGQVKSFGALTFARIYDAGHMVPYDQPEASLEMVNQWISNLHLRSD